MEIFDNLIEQNPENIELINFKHLILNLKKNEHPYKEPLATDFDWYYDYFSDLLKIEAYDLFMKEFMQELTQWC